LRFLLEHPDFELKQATGLGWDGPDRLVDLGFLFASNEYKNYVGTNSQIDLTLRSTPKACSTLG
jgi:hypothetical protein